MLLQTLSPTKTAAAKSRRTDRSRPELAVALLHLLRNHRKDSRFHPVGDSVYGGQSVLCNLPEDYALLALAGMLLAVGIGSAQAEVAVDNTHPRRLRPSRSSPCRSPARRPELVCIDGFKPGTVQLVAWQTAYADKVKDLDGSVEIKDYPNDDHFSLPERCVPDARKWLNDLFSSSLPGASLR
jgi:hypothetical protein